MRAERPEGRKQSKNWTTDKRRNWKEKKKKKNKTKAAWIQVENDNVRISLRLFTHQSPPTGTSLDKHQGKEYVLNINVWMDGKEV